jgi:hypothetical protein
MSAQPSRVRSAVRIAAAGAFVLTCVPGWAGPARAASSVPVTPLAESWYRPLSPLCTTPAGCPPVELPPGYPDGTLHVGVLGGAEDSTTYIALPLPSSGLQGGSLRLPVGPIEDGTLLPESAKVKACVVIGNVPKVAGSWGTRPGVDCSSTSPAVVTSGGTVLTVDLAPFLVEWEGEPVGALALVPADVPAVTDVWHLAFSRHDRTGAAVQPLSATLLVDGDTGPLAPFPEDDTTGEEPQQPVLPPVAQPPFIGPGVLPGSDPVPPTVARPSTAPGSIRPVASSTLDTSFAYPGVFLLPPLVLLAGGWIARAFTRSLGTQR